MVTGRQQRGAAAAVAAVAAGSRACRCWRPPPPKHPAGFLDCCCQPVATRNPKPPHIQSRSAAPTLPCSRLRDASGSRFRLLDSFEEDICSTDPFLVLHKIESPAKMRFMGQRVANCTAPEPWVLAKSIEKYVAPETRENWDEQREAVLAARPSSSKGKGGKGKAAAAAAAAGGEEEEDEGAALQKAAAAAVASQPEEDEEDEGSRDEHAQTALDDDGHR